MMREAGCFKATRSKPTSLEKIKTVFQKQIYLDRKRFALRKQKACFKDAIIQARSPPLLTTGCGVRGLSAEAMRRDAVLILKTSKNEKFLNLLLGLRFDSSYASAFLPV